MLNIYMSDVNCREICELGSVEQVCETCSLAKTAHGKVWENPVCRAVLNDFGFDTDSTDFNLHYNEWLENSAIDTTAPHDIAENLMPGWSWDDGRTLDGRKIKEKYGEGISVKLIKKGCDVCIGKLSRIWDHFNDGPWSMIVGFYKEKKINGVKCLCIDQVYYVPFLRGRTDRDLFFGDVDNNWKNNLELLESKVKEAWSYKGGKKGVRGLLDDSIPMISFDSLTPGKKEWRRRGGTDRNSTPEAIREACIKCAEDIAELRGSLRVSNDIPSQTAVKLSGGNARVQGKISYKNFLRLVEELGENITNEEAIQNNEVLSPIKKMNLSGESKEGGGSVKKRTKKRRKGGGRKRRTRKRSRRRGGKRSNRRSNRKNTKKRTKKRVHKRK
jgi:hypothetical protein